MVGDLILAIRLRGYDETILQNWEPLQQSINSERGRARS